MPSSHYTTLALIFHSTTVFGAPRQKLQIRGELAFAMWSVQRCKPRGEETCYFVTMCANDNTPKPLLN